MKLSISNNVMSANGAYLPACLNFLAALIGRRFTSTWDPSRGGGGGRQEIKQAKCRVNEDHITQQVYQER